jgi:hypothetical protein
VSDGLVYGWPMRGRWRPSLWVSSLALLAGVTGCVSEISAELSIDGEAFEPTSCRSGQANGFAGVDLTDNSGRTLRLAQSPTNQPQAILLAGEQVVDVGLCGTLSVQRQSSTVNDITNVMGEAKLECETTGHTVAGTVSFKNCH